MSARAARRGKRTVTPGRLHEWEYDAIRKSVVDAVLLAGADRKKIIKAMQPILGCCFKDGEWYAYWLRGTAENCEGKTWRETRDPR